MNNQRRIVCKAIDEQTTRPLTDRGVDPSWFSGDDREAITFIYDHVTKYGKTPEKSTFYTHMGTTFKIVTVLEAWDYLIDELANLNRWSESKRILPDVQDLLKAGETEKAVARMVDGLTAIEKFAITTTRLTDSMDNARVAERWAAYEAREKGGGVIGYSTGFATIDRATLGLQPGHLVTVLAQPKVGKTSICMVMANHIYTENKLPVLFASFEMGHNELEMRQESLLAGVSFRDLQRGTLDPVSRNKYAAYMDKVEDEYDWPFHFMDASGGSTVSAIRAQIEKTEPAVVFLDGIYMMNDEVSGEQNTSTALTNITRSLKKLAVQTKRPIVINTQALSWKSKGVKITMDSAGYSSSFAQDSDVILGLERMKTGKDEDESTYAYQRILKVLASRNTGLAQVELVFDYEEGVIQEIA